MASTWAPTAPTAPGWAGAAQHTLAQYRRHRAWLAEHAAWLAERPLFWRN